MIRIGQLYNVMASDHYINIIHKQIELVYYSGMSWACVEEMSSDELEYVLHNFKIIKETEEKNKQEVRKTIFEYVNKAVEALFKLLANLGKTKQN
jgi:hypothetical protein